MSSLRPRWTYDAVRPEVVERLDEHDYRVLLAEEAQRIAGGLAFALDVRDTETSDRFVRRLRAISDALTSGIGEGLVAGECVRGDVASSTDGARLFVGGTPSFWDGLRPLLRGARAVDIVVAYATDGGVALLRQLLLGSAPGSLRLRMLVGCYLGGTRPAALRALLSLFDAHTWAEGSALRFVADPHRHFHPKVYRVLDDAGRAHVSVGSTNLSRSALDGPDAVEWNALFDASTSASLVRTADVHLERLLTTEGAIVDDGSIDGLVAQLLAALPPAAMLEPETSLVDRPMPTPAQAEALEALHRVRAAGHTRALVVAATGLGKTLLAALDSLSVVPPSRGRILFVAHREELLLQARRAFERVRGPSESSGLVKQSERGFDADLVFASVFSLDRIPEEHLASFDYVVVDEAHHAAAKSYRRLFDGANARFTLGLTATPDRQDGGDIYALFDGVVAYEKPLLDAIASEWLVPFRYFGIPDTVDYRTLTWVGGPLGYREHELERAVIDDARMARVIDALAVPGREGRRTLFFCVGIRHAQHTTAALRHAGWRVARIDSAPSADDRATAITALARGELDAIVSVDMLNEGVDVPSVDRVVLLRPTDSRTVFLQQLGRGLRRASGKTHLTVVDLVGNHRRAREHLALLGMPSGVLSVAAPGVELSYRVAHSEIFLEPAAVDAVRAVGGAGGTTRARLLDAVRELAEREGDGESGRKPPRLIDVLAHTGLALATIRASFGSWFGLLEAAGVEVPELSEGTREFLEVVESTNMTGAHKMLFLAGLASARRRDATVDEAARWMRDVLRSRHPAARIEFQSDAAREWLESGRPSRDIPRRYPMNVLADAHPRFFAWSEGRLSLRSVGNEADLFELVAERAEARLFEHARNSGASGLVGTIIPQGDRGLLLQVARDADRIAAISTWVRLVIDGDVFYGLRQKIAINRIHREPDDASNLATEVLLRASEADTIDGARGRKLRFVPDPGGGFSLELFRAAEL